MSRSESEEREGDEELVPETPAPVQIRDCTVLQGADLVADPDYPVGSFEVPADDPSANPLSVALIAVATVEDRVVVAIPFAAWHRTVLRRVLPPGALARPLPLSVDLVDRSAEGGEHPFLETAKIWIGTLAASAEDSVFFDPNGVLDAPDFPFSTQSPSSLPSATSLEAAFQQHFAFVSAASGASGGGGGRATASGGDAVSARLQQLEQSVQSIASSLQQLTRGGTPLQAGQETCPPPPGLPSPKPAARKKTEGSQPSLPPGANMDIVNSARQAGVPEKQIREMLELAMKGRSKLPDFPAADGRKSRKNILSETEDEEEDAEEPGLPGGDPLAAAVTKLDLGEEEKPHLGVHLRRCWVSRDVRNHRFFEQQETGRSVESFPICIAKAAGSYQQSHREEHGGGLWKGDSNAWQLRGQCLSPCMVRTSSTSARIPDPCSLSVGSGRRPRRHSCRTSSGSKSEMRAHPGDGRSNVYRPGVVGGGRRNWAGGPASDGVVQFSHVAIGGGASVHKVDRRQMDGAHSFEAQRCGQPQREEKEVSWPQSDNHHYIRNRAAKAQPEAQRRRQGRQGKVSCRGRQSPRSRESVMETFLSGDGKVGVAAGGTASSTSPLPHPNGGNPGVVSDEPAPPKTNAPRAPGALATTVQVEHVWDPLCRWVLSSRRSQSLSSFCHSTFSRQIHQANHPDTRPVWPIPMPYPNLAAEGTSREQSFQRAINMMVITLNWLHLGGPRRIPSDFYSRARLTPEQLGIVSRLRRLAQEWNESGPIQAEDMGRSAGKIESLEATVQQLTAAAIRLASSGGSQRQGSGFKKTEKKDPKSTLLGEVQLAKEVECDRLSFKGVPSFNPAPFLESEARRMYEDPLADALPPEEALQAPPHVQVRGSYKEILKLCRKLDDSSRLALLDPALVRPGREAGLFSLMKSVTADRMILDSRPANELEVGLTEWTATMASTCPLLDLVIPAGYQAVAAGEDLRDYYYFFRVTGRRSLRNAIKFRIPLSEARKLRAYAAAPPGLDHYVAGLQTMAMGDLNAVEIGQQSHVKLAISAGVCLEDLLTLRGRLPRTGPYVGIVIDDFIVVECIPSDPPEPQDLLSSRIADRMVETYDAVGLLSHDKKRFRAERRAQFWGSSFDGVAGTLRMQLEKVIPIALITAQVARLGMANRKLLEVLCGSWVAILQCRRRAMCLIDSAFADIQSNDYHVNFHLAPATIDELWSLVILAPLFVADLRAEVCDELGSRGYYIPGAPFSRRALSSEVDEGSLVPLALTVEG